ncbi:GDP-mannose 4,6-dehydratase [Candidatus Gottesmanbacteria bacterium]|nr:GDP-mannose 4,6-dehydratase [Candidatus Gottesmanbacteria bacterium]
MEYKKFLITGATGFVGSHLVEKLVNLKSKVLATTHHPILPHSYFKTKNLSQKCEVVKIDLCDLSKTVKLIENFKPDYIFHLAAQPLVEVAYADPKNTLYSNIVGTINVLESTRLLSKIKGIIVASSDKAYGKIDPKTNRKYIESDPLRGDHPYEVSKSSVDLIAYSYFKTYNLPVVITRFGNIYGQGDIHFSRLIPGIIKAIIHNELFGIRSNGKFVRDYLYVKDVVLGYLTLADNIDKVKGGAFNFGSDESYNVLELIKVLTGILRKPLKYKILNIPKNEIPYQSLDWSKIRKTLGWQPKYSLQTTINEIYRWYLKYF